MRLQNKVALITGGGTGIGEATAKLFAQEGALVAITGRRKEVLGKVVTDIRQRGGQALALPGSVTHEPDVQEAIGSTVRTFGRVDVLVNNAGNLFYTGPLHETTDGIWNETLDIFLSGVFRFSRAAIPQMLKQGSGNILNISTIGGLKAISGFEAHAYQAAKAGVIMLTKTIAAHYAKRGIRCNCICPAVVETPAASSWLGDPTSRMWLENLHPIGRVGQPEEIAQATLYFASDESSWTTGSILTVDGGVMTQ
jgi:NAD(P)-dependent dehydrogenase (short-subunit alcohol dehydrogenase family)